MKKKRRNIHLAAVSLAAAAVLLLIVLMMSGRASAEGTEDSMKSITDTIMQRALQCYVIEGAYPQSLEYLEENYGLTVNHADYLIIYTPFAENLPPEVKVLDRKRQGDAETADIS